MPITRSRGNPVTCFVTQHMTSSGFETTRTIASAQWRLISSETCFTMSALVRTRSSRLMPGLRAMPAVTTTSSLPAAGPQSFAPTTRVSKPSIGADSHWSSPLPWGTPSITSRRTTRRASCFSARRWAAVAPTLPAPTTVILLSIWPVGVKCRQLTPDGVRLEARPCSERRGELGVAAYGVQNTAAATRAKMRHMRRLSHASFPLSTTWRGGQGVRSPAPGVHLPVRIGAQRVDPIERAAIRDAEPLLGPAIGAALPRRPDERRQLLVARAAAQTLAQIDPARRVQTQKPRAVRGDAAAVAGAAERRGDRSDDPERRAGRETEPLGGGAAVAGYRSDRAVALCQRGEHVALRYHLVHRPVRRPTHVHVLDEPQLRALVANASIRSGRSVSRLTVTRRRPAARNAGACFASSRPFVVNARSSISGIRAISRTGAGRSCRIRGSPPVTRTLRTPSPANTRTTRSSSSNVRIDARGSHTYSSSGMQ